jgi:ribosome maturation protein SDO1
MQVPLNQVRHSNVAVSRYTKNGVRLEIACYKNKVLSYRSGLETRMEEVLQVDRVFTNVGRGSYASAADILKALGPGHTEASALKFVLDHGDLQVAQHERTSEVDEVLKDVITIISQKCVHTATKRPFPAHVIEQALKTMGAAVKPDQPAKKQALHLIQKLVDSNILPIQRANMKLRVTIVAPTSSSEEEGTIASTSASVQAWFTSNGAEVVLDVVTSSGVVVGGDASAAPAASSSSSSVTSFAVLLPPHQFRDAEAFVKTVPGCSLNVVETSVAETGEGAASDLQVAMQQQAALQSAPPPAATTSKPAAASVQKHNNASKKHVADVSSEGGDSKEVVEQKKGRKIQSSAKGQVGGISAVSDDDDEDDDKRKKSKKAKKSQAPHQPTAPKPVVKKQVEEGEGSDDDVVSERKKKGKPAVAAVSNQNDDDDFDYGEDDE